MIKKIKSIGGAVIIIATFITVANLFLAEWLDQYSLYNYNFKIILPVTVLSLSAGLLYIWAIVNKLPKILEAAGRIVPISQSESLNEFLARDKTEKISRVALIHSPLLLLCLFPLYIIIPILGNFRISLNEILKILIPLLLLLSIGSRYYGITIKKINSFFSLSGGREEMAERSEFFLLAGSSFLMFIFFTFFISITFFALGFSLSKWIIPLSFISTVIFLWLGLRKNVERNLIKKFTAIIILFAVSFTVFALFSSRFYNFGADSQEYHSEMVIQMKNGWNPFYESLKDGDYDYIEHKPGKAVVLNSFSKCSETVAAAAYIFLNSYEGAKVFQYIFILAAFFLSASVFLNLKKLPFAVSILLGLLITLNPVAVTQSLSFYVDGELASILLIISALGALLFFYDKIFIRILLCAAIILGVNIKFTGLFFSMIIAAGIFFCYLIFDKSKFSFKIIGAVAGAFLIGFFVAGYNPYVTNINNCGSPFCPYFVSEEKIEELKGTQKSLKKIGEVHAVDINLFANRISSLISTVFSKTKNGYCNFTLEWPFSIDKKELSLLMQPYPRTLGGFGPLFRSAAPLAILLILFSFSLSIRKTLVVFFMSIWILFSVLIIIFGCYARYGPQLWMIAVITIPLGLYINRRMLRFLSYAIIMILLSNILLAGRFYLKGQYYAMRGFQAKYNKYTESAEPIKISFFPPFRSCYKQRFNDMGIKYNEIKYSEKEGADLIVDRFFFDDAYSAGINQKRRRNQ